MVAPVNVLVTETTDTKVLTVQSVLHLSRGFPLGLGQGLGPRLGLGRGEVVFEVLVVASMCHFRG